MPAFDDLGIYGEKKANPAAGSPGTGKIPVWVWVLGAIGVAKLLKLF